MRTFIWLAAPMVFASLMAEASVSLNDYSLTSKLLPQPAWLQVNVAGISEYDKKAWTIEKQDDGVELYTSKSKLQARAAIARNSNGDLDSMTSFKLDGKGSEQSGALIFSKGALQSFTSCEDQATVGRVCVTATQDLCHALKIGNVKPDDMKSMDALEMRALANLLTLRGSDHQLDNMAKTGNKLGLKTALQTTKGQLFALAKEIERETRAPSAIAPPASDKLAQTVLEKSLPRLKQACLDTHFN